jgi:hypothetical protein
MRRFALLILPAALALTLDRPAQAQHWNDSGPGRDLLGSTVSDFDAFRERTPATPSFTPGTPGAAFTPGAAAQAPARGPIPLLDWVPPAPVPAAAAARRSSPQRRTVRRAPASQPVREVAPVAAARTTTPAAGGDWERSLAERERELERLRRILEDDRLRYQQVRQPQLQ